VKRKPGRPKLPKGNAKGRIVPIRFTDELCADWLGRVWPILSVVESCRRLKIPVRDYLGSILPGLANTPIQRVPELTPIAYV
jgi:hypothetical protein